MKRGNRKENPKLMLPAGSYSGMILRTRERPGKKGIRWSSRHGKVMPFPPIVCPNCA